MLKIKALKVLHSFLYLYLNEIYILYKILFAHSAQ